MGLIAGRRHGTDRSDETLPRWALRYGVVAAVIVAAFALTIVGLNQTLYSAQGFVGGYLGALARHDATTALATPGVQVAEQASGANPGDTALLAGAALGALTDIRLRSDSARSGGARHLIFSVTLDGTPRDAAFDVRPASARLGFFSSWEFVTSPTSRIEITPVSDPTFDANGVTVTSGSGVGVAVDYAVLTPGVVSISQKSDYLIAKPQSIIVAVPGETVRASITATANPTFVALVQKELDATLRSCTTQTVLQPTGCPFGENIDNRVDGLPAWSMTTFPAVTIVPGSTPGTWLVPQTEGAAHLRVGVQSLFDGTRSIVDQDIPFTVSYLITMGRSGALTITEQ